ncbi:response regulator [Pseudorhodobacter sp. E13]|uniref:hybrid sensor histidine kinase/response regulator n=1 Tax=Pseudorhodobacter sp. E13 TaxID=2487931 RepID=UPI000F8E448C|nr:response regulator [Pseudorhodobacter sp. E13]RUS61016.1 response regulator [Pseudorhodobacter sp. E13]
MDIVERLATERRKRLAAERLLEQKQRELYAANEKLALHARALSDQIVEQRHATKAALNEAQSLKGQNSRFLADLEAAHTSAVMAERRLRDSVNALHDGFAVFTPDHRLLVANRAYLAPYQDYNVGPGTPYAEILKLTAEEGMVDIGDSSPDEWVARMLSRWDSDPIEPEVVQGTNGEWIRLVDRRARDGDMVCLALNITEQMRIWAALEAIPDGFVLFDREDRLLACNQRYRELYPESAEAMVPGAPFEEILRYGLDRGQYKDAIGREAEWLQERLERHHDTSSILEQELEGGRWLRVLEQPTPDGGRVGLRVDITHQKEQQAALNEARKAAEAANRAKSAFLANMSHEIRTPMNGVVGMAELLCDTGLTEEQRLFADTIRSSGEALLVIINDILDYSKIEAERLTLHPEPFDLERLIHEVAMLLQPSARERGLDLMIDFDMFLPTRFIGDAGRLRQILTNLVGNAVKFTEKGHVLIRIVGIETEPGNQQLHISVEDTGIGIPADQLEHVFGEFNQVESAANRKFEGTGLGLAITQRLIDRMGGSVWVDSEFGKGSCFGFRIELPVAEDQATIPVPVTLKRAIVVDDQFINRTILERQLITCGMQVKTCRTGAEVVAALEKDSGFDVLITDHEMPEMNGLQLAETLRGAGHNLPIVLLSSNPAAARDGLSAAHVTTVLQKPLLRSELYRRLRDLAAPPPSHMVAPAKPRSAGPERIMRVLAAEDNRTNQLVFRKMVKDLQIDLTFANNGREAVELFQSFQPDLIFMDISMPELDGKDAAREIRTIEQAKGGHVPIVALTAHAMDGDDTSILASGIDEYLTKPLRKTAITEALLNHAPSSVFPVTNAKTSELA